uniref:Uncharacterized protein n=1 Tax=Octopus bimaculoides TaxID=37653 RepID=A0A0L8I7B1_OCTBM
MSLITADLWLTNNRRLNTGLILIKILTKKYHSPPISHGTLYTLKRIREQEMKWSDVLYFARDITFMN